MDVPPLGGVRHVTRVNQQAKDLGLVNAEKTRRIAFTVYKFFGEMQMKFC